MTSKPKAEHLPEILGISWTFLNQFKTYSLSSLGMAFKQIYVVQTDEFNLNIKTPLILKKVNFEFAGGEYVTRF